MDSERRHELEENSLARALGKAPSFLWEYGAYVLLGLAVVVSVFFYMRTRSSAELSKREAEAASLYNMNTALDRAKEARQFAAFLPPEELAARQEDAASEIQQWASIPSDSERPGVRAHALRLRGDMAWTLASFPPPRKPVPATQPASTTQPATRPATDLAGGNTRSAEDWLADAEAAYSQVLKEYPDQTADVLAALFGLAAIAEQRGNFQGAVGFYDQIIARDDIGEGAHTLAERRKDMLQILRVNPRLGAPRTPATQPATQPTTGPVTQPAAGPGDVEPLSPPTTAPATQPG